MKTKNTYRILAAVLALLVLLGQLPAPARAAETTGLCEHHTAHEDCGYVEGDPNQPCTFRCGQCAQEPTTTGAPDGAPPACVCTDKCAAESANPDCPVCYADVTECAGQEPTATGNQATPTATGNQATPTATGIQVTTPPAKNQYQLQEPLDLTGGVLTVTYSDGSTQDMAITPDMVSGFKNDTACTLTLTVTWGGFEAYFDVTVLQPQWGSASQEGNTTSQEEEPAVARTVDTQSTAQIDWVELSTIPSKIQYVQNTDELDVSDGVLTVHYTDGTTEDVAMTPEMVTGFDNTVLGARWLEVHYQGYFVLSYVIGIVESEDKPIVLTGNINIRTTYIQGESIDLDGAALLLNYSDGNDESVPITEDMVEDFDTKTTGYKTLLIQYKDTTYSQGYEVLSPEMLRGDCGNASWELVDGVLWITGTGEVTENPWQQYNSLIKSIEVSEGITSVGDFAFANCTNLTSVSLPSTLESISEGAFSNCVALTEITIPQNVTEIGQNAFGSSGLKEVTIPKNVERIGAYAFSNCTNLTSVSLPSTLETISEGAFSNCAALTEITIPQNVTRIGYDAFRSSGLKEVTIPKNVERIGAYAFASCTALQTITFETKEPPMSDNNFFDGVTATAYYPATARWSGYWANYLFRYCGGEIDWKAVGETVESISLDITYQELTVGESFNLHVSGIPGYLLVDFEAVTDSDAVGIRKDDNGYLCVFAQEPGTATITVTDKRSGCTATATVVVKESVSTPIDNCPYSADIPFNNFGAASQCFTFTPTQSGEYVFSATLESDHPVMMPMYAPVIEIIYDSGSSQGIYVEPLESGHYGTSTRYICALEAGTAYLIVPSMRDAYATSDWSLHFHMDFPVSVNAAEIVRENNTIYGAAGEDFYESFVYAKLTPENAIGEITWESSDPGIISLEDWGYGFVNMITHGEGSATITARCGEVSDSITVTTQKPQALTLDTPIQQEIDDRGGVIYSFTPEETGRYTFEFVTDDGAPFSWFCGKYDPADLNYSRDYTTNHGVCTAGVTYYLLCGTNLSENTRGIITVKKEEAVPVAMNVHCGSYYSNGMYFTVEFVPSNSYDEIVSWESSAPEILDISYGHSTGCSAYIYGTGEVTVTATSAGGLRASCTVTVGQCDSGHTYGPWRQTREPGCAIDGLETATCICGLRKYRSIPATGHTYDNNCDPDCNTCGETRTVEHSFSQGWAYSETAHWHVCTVCGERSQIENHVPGPAATQDSPQTCTLCGCVLKSALGHSHGYGDAWVCDDTGHWHACDGCSARKDYSGHVYTDACDPTCNICGYVRENIHISGGVLFSDRGGHWYTCTLCGTKLDHHAHEPGAAATATTPQLCAVCGYVLQKATGQTTTIIQQTVTNATGHTHRYDTRLTMDEDGHWYACSGCATRKDYERHRYTDDCDPDCAVCGYTRTVSHNAGAEWASDGTGHWYPCLDCGEKRNFAEHRMENGVCTVCGYAQQEEQPPAAQPPTEPTAPAAPDTGAGGDGTAGDQSQGLPWWMLLVAGLVSSAATLTIAGAVLWANRKKIAALFTGK